MMNLYRLIFEESYTLSYFYLLNRVGHLPGNKQVDVVGENIAFQAWVQLNPDKVLENGNHELKYVFKQDFNLEKTLGKYPIRELENETYKKSLIDSLHRGLKVYDGNKQPLTNDQLVTKLYISKEMAAELKDWIGTNLGDLKQEQKLGHKQEVSEAGEKLNGKKVKQDKEGQGQTVKKTKVQKPRKPRIGR